MEKWNGGQGFFQPIIPIFQVLSFQHSINPILFNLQGKIQFIPLLIQYIYNRGSHVSH
jgi:hypothetical protein